IAAGMTGRAGGNPAHGADGNGKKQQATEPHPFRCAGVFLARVFLWRAAAFFRRHAVALAGGLAASLAAILAMAVFTRGIISCHDYIVVGADTPSKSRPLAMTCRVACANARRALLRAGSATRNVCAL